MKKFHQAIDAEGMSKIMNLTIRTVQPHEVKALKKQAQKAFGLAEGLFLSSVKEAQVAVVDDALVACFAYKIIQSGNKKVGYISLLFTDPAFQGQGIASQICAEGVQHLWALGCDALVTFVRDDNVGSWGSFAKSGFVKASLPQMTGPFGLMGTVKLCWETTYLFSIGHDFYVALRDETDALEKKGGVGQAALQVLLSTLLLDAAFRADAHILYGVLFAALVFAGFIVAGGLGTLCSRRGWRFRITSGGLLVYAAINFFTGFPLLGAWYPARYEKTPAFKRDMALPVVTAWMFLLGLAAVAAFMDVPFAQYFAPVARMLLIFRCLPVAVFDSSGFGRVFQWSKPVAVLLVAASLYLIFGV